MKLITGWFREERGLAIETLSGVYLNHPG
ncbi:hypothetical protein C439_08150 [Haloferax mediterranei ATCC 33500]|nr:hypothetical protein C439_08150 [Haloferax mediterranei ATCC 33500]